MIRENKMDKNERFSFGEQGKINYLTPENCSFTVTETGFVEVKIEGGEETRAYLYRAFPHDLPDRYVSVMDDEKNELGIIEDLSIFDEKTAAALRRDLERRYYIPKIREICALEEKFGNSFWHIKTDAGEKVITINDTFKSIIRIGEDRAIVLDEDGNRYEIESFEALDRKSLRRIELFL